MIFTETRDPRPEFPSSAWYAVADSDDLDRKPLARRVLDRPLVIYRDSAGRPIGLADRCVHRPYPLSLGTVVGDDIVASYTGFVYGPDGMVKAVPSQDEVPVGARVQSYPMTEHSGLVWAWLGPPGVAALRSLPELPWINGPGWATFGGSWELLAHASLLQDNFADITHVPHLDPLLAPPALLGTVPAIEVEVSEQQVRFYRTYPPSRLQTWQQQVLGTPADGEYEQYEEGRFVAPGLWVDRWDVRLPETVATFYFTHAITPIDDRTTRHVWAVSRNVALDPATTEVLTPLLRSYYQRVQEALEVMQGVIDRDGPRRDVSLRADLAQLQVRRIMRRLVAEEA